MIACTFTVTVNDTEAPEVTVDADITVQLDATGSVTLTNADFAAVLTATDNCDIYNIRTKPNTVELRTFTCADIATNNTDANKRKVRVRDVNGNNTDVFVNVIVEDNEDPVVTDVQDIIAVLDNTGNIVLKNNIDVAPAVTASDNCDIDWIRIRGGKNNRTFGCADILTNPNVRTIRVRDVNGNNTDVPVNVIVQDNRPQGNYDGDALGDLCDEDDDNDGCLDIYDPHPFSIQTATIVVFGCDTGVENTVLGCSTLADMLNDCSVYTSSYYSYRMCLINTLRSWLIQGLINSRERRAIFECAIRNYNYNAQARSGANADYEIEEQVFDVNLSPNPSKNHFNLDIQVKNRLDKVDIQVMDVTGKLIHADQFEGDQLYKFGESLQAGIYFVRISQASDTKTIRVIKQ